MRVGKRELAFLLMVVSYVVSGKAALMLALPPGYASAIFPPAGIAVAAAFIAGRRALPWVFLGSLVLNIWVAYASHPHLDMPGFFAAVLIAAASVLQAGVGGWLLRRRIGYPAAFDNVHDVFSFLLLSPLICLVSSTVSVAGLGLLGIFDASTIGENWFSWWIGDSLGVLVALPVVLVFFGQPRDLWRRRAATVALPMLFILALFIAIFVKTSQWEEEESLAEFRQVSQQTMSQIQTKLDEQASIAIELGALFLHDVHGQVTRKEFHRFAQGVLPHFPMIQAMEWVPHVSGADRARFEASQRRELPGFQITERSAAGELRRAGARRSYFPVTYVEPLATNEQAVGFDLASNTKRWTALERALDTGLPSATAPIHLVQAPRKDEHGMLILQSVGSKGHELGVALTVLKLEKLVGEVARPSGRTLHIRLTDSDSGQVTFDTVGEYAGAVRFDRSFRFGSRHYRFQSIPTAAYLSKHRGWQAWTVLAMGTLGASLVGVLLLLGTGYTARVVGQVEKRTRALRKSEARLKQAQRSAQIGNWELDLVNDKLYWSDEIYRMFEIERAESAASYADFLAAVHPDDRERVSKAYADSLVTREPYDIVHRLLFPDGRVKFVQERCETVFDAEGRPLRSMGTVQDITRMEELQRALRKSEAQARMAIDASRSALWDYDIMNKTVHLSEAWAQFMGGDPGPTDTSIDALLARVPEEEQIAVRESFFRAVKGTGADMYRVEHRVRTNDGSHIWVHSEGRVVERNAEGLAVRMLGINRDITEQKRIEDAIKERDARLNLLIDHAPAALAMFDPEMRYLAVSKRWLKDYALEGQPVIGRRYYDALPDAPEHWKEMHRMGLQGAVLHSDGEPFMRSDGTTQWLKWEIRPWYGENDAVGGIIIFSEDITDAREKYLAEMLERDVRYRMAIETAEDGFWTVDMQGHITDVNESYVRMSGYGREQLLRMCVWDLDAQDSMEVVAARTEQILAAGGHTRFESTHRRRDGSTWPVDVTITYTASAGGSFFVFISDLTERKQAAQALQKARETAYRDTLVREVHHRIKNNLHGLTGILRRHARAHPEVADALNGISAQIQSIAITHGLQGNVELRKVDLNHLLSAIVAEARSIWLKPVEIHIAPEASRCIIVESESVPVALILNELMANAVKHSRADSAIAVSVDYAPQTNRALISISNEGVLPDGFGLADVSVLGTGLRLVSSLMPQIGAVLDWQQAGGRAVARLSLEAPVIYSLHGSIPDGGRER